jgi:acetyl coenzyme A synthetase (ADP forming)-like protein
LKNNLDSIFRPGSIALVGASRTPSTIGWMLLDNLLRYGYTGAVYPVNPKARAVHGVPAWPSVSSIPGDVDLAIIAVPKAFVAEVAEECGRKGVKAIVVITAGFKEVGPAGAGREQEVLAIARRHGMRMVGPNCLGVLNTSPDLRLNATFAPVMPPPGPVSFMSQSGAMGVTILDYAAEYGIGINHFASVGNKADVSGNDLMEYWCHDDATRVILMYLENFGNPRQFTRTARRLSRQKPIIAVKAGRTLAGARAASSHTGALAALDTATDALMGQCGVIRVDTVEELFDMAMAFGRLPMPADDKVAIITNAGGPGIIIADACESAGLRVAELSPATQARLRRDLPDEASVRNPVDMIATATAENYRLALEAVLADPNVSAAIAAFVPPLGVKQTDVALQIVEARDVHREKPVLAVLMGREGLPQGRAELNEAGIPGYIFPESAARALAAMNRYREWREHPEGTYRRFDVDMAIAAASLARPSADGFLPTADARALLAAYGIPAVGARMASSEAAAVAAAAAVGYPVALKIVSPDIIHKSDVGGVVVDVRDEEELRKAYTGMLERVRAEAPAARIAGVQVEQYVKGGVETIVGMSTDPTFGAVLMFGLGGIYVEALKDVTFGVQPVSDIDARTMVTSIRSASILEGMRGEPPSDIPLLVEVLQRISQLVEDHPAIVELDINPFVVFEKGGVALDVRVRVAAGA